MTLKAVFFLKTALSSSGNSFIVEKQPKKLPNLEVKHICNQGETDDMQKEETTRVSRC